MPKCKIEVTKQHIKDGDPTDAWTSATARALNYAGFTKASVIGDAFLDTVDGRRIRVPLPVKAQVAASELANHELVAPFSFEFEYPEEVIRKTYEHPPKWLLTNSKPEDHAISLIPYNERTQAEFEVDL